MKNLYKSACTLALFFAFGLFAAACGDAPQTEEKTDKEKTEAPADTTEANDEHPSEHPSEHPGDGEHPSEDEHPN